MIKETLRRFCESRHRWLIVIAGTFGIGLLMVMPLVDTYCAERAEKNALSAELESARLIAAKLGSYETRVAEKLAQLDEVEARTIDDESLPVFREKLVDLAKETGCSIRRLHVGPVSLRPWTAGDDPTATELVASRDEAVTEFMLEWRPISISVSGSNSSLHNMLDRIAAIGLLIHTKSLEMYPSNPSRQSLTIDMELWCYTLSRRS